MGAISLEKVRQYLVRLKMCKFYDPAVTAPETLTPVAQETCMQTFTAALFVTPNLENTALPQQGNA